ncbi:MAG TPA: hypothetical protein VGL87_13195 [Steroidobacteraceae bacterium]
MKYLVATLSTAGLLAVAAFIGGGYLNTRRAEHKADDLRASVHAMTQQELAAAVARCDAPASPDAPPGADEPRPGAARRGAAYCEDVAQEMDDRPLEIVKGRPPAVAPSPR